MKCVRLRRIPKEKKFKGSAFIEFSTEEEAQKVAKLKIKVNDKELLILPK